MTKKLNKLDFFLAINKRMNGNFNEGDNQFTVPTKKITKGEELKMLRKFQQTTKVRSK